MASVDEGAASAHKRLVRAVIGSRSLSANGVALKKYAGFTVSGRVRIAAAALFFVAGKIALRAGI